MRRWHSCAPSTQVVRCSRSGSSSDCASQVLAASMLLVVVFAAVAGSGIPLLLHRVGIDPAVATGPFITTANDVVSMLIYLGVATLLLSVGSAPAT